MSIELKKEKSRNLSIYEFFEILQKEYVCAILRLKIYTKVKDKEYWKKVAEGKKATIENIAEKNHLPSIFTDKDLERDIDKKVIRDFGLPNFIYKNEDHKLAQEYYDLLYYYKRGAEVRFELYGETKVGVVKSYKPYQNSIVITTKDTKEDVTYTIDKVTRIL